MTADELRISDGSSDVCSSDLRCAQKGGRAHGLSRIFIASARLFAADRRYQGSRPGCRRNGARIWKAGERPAISRPLTTPPPHARTRNPPYNAQHTSEQQPTAHTLTHTTPTTASCFSKTHK